MEKIKKVNVNGQEYELAGSGSGTGELVEITYDELVNLADSNALIPGNFYKITDYVTDYIGSLSDRNSAKHAFDLIVKAISNSEISEEARAAIHSGDSYFKADDSLDKWEIWYKLKDSSYSKGVITRMIDADNNDFPYDFKNLRKKIRFSDLGLSEISEDVTDFFYTFSVITIGDAGTVDSIVDGSVQGEESLRPAIVSSNISRLDSGVICTFIITKGLLSSNITNNIINSTVSTPFTIAVKGPSIMSKITYNIFNKKVELYGNNNIGTTFLPSSFTNNVINQDLVFSCKIAAEIDNNNFNMLSSGNTILVLNASKFKSNLFLGEAPNSNRDDIKKVGTGSETYTGSIISSDGSAIKIV